jgi:hypothetical protein
MNELNVDELRAVVLVIDTLAGIDTSVVSFGDVKLFDTNGDELGSITYSDTQYVFVPYN